MADEDFLGVAGLRPLSAGQPLLEHRQRSGQGYPQAAAERYSVIDAKGYVGSQQLRVLIAAPDANYRLRKRAFFFLADEYFGTDASEPSRQISFEGIFSIERR